MTAFRLTHHQVCVCAKVDGVVVLDFLVGKVMMFHLSGEPCTVMVHVQT